ncbi:MAG: hypothetical protein ACJAS1_003661 [Oleiphilaceae bacterium]|jgi:hypothetical protein
MTSLSYMPNSVSTDAKEGFIVIDEEVTFLRAKTLSGTVFHFKYGCIEDADFHERVIDIEQIDQQIAIFGYFRSLSEVHEKYGRRANMVIAESNFKRDILPFWLRG